MKISKFALGTVQLGMPYGVNNTTGQPSLQESVAILETAIAGGIRTIDTAFAYGNAEERIGKFLAQNASVAPMLKIISKLEPHIIAGESENVSEKRVCRIVEEALLKSLERLGISKLNGYLLHTPHYLFNKKIINALQYCKEKQLTEHIGVSIYGTDEAMYATRQSQIDYIQIPFNIFDQRLARDDFYRLTRKNNITVFARSPFLQGLMFKNPESAPAHIPNADSYLSLLREILQKYNMSVLEAALFFSYTVSGADYIVFGTETVRQIRENLQIVNLEESERWARCVEELKSSFSSMEKHIIFPSLWKDSFSK